MFIWDDPLEPMANGSRPCDDVGLPSRRVALIERGVIREALFDLQSVGQEGRRSTASAHPGVGSTPSPGASVVHVAGGTRRTRKSLAGVNGGLIIEDLLGAGQGNELGGDFRANVSLGYRVRDGEIDGRVKDTMISGNVYRALSNIEAISPDVEVGVRLHALPSHRVPRIEVMAKG